MFTPTPPSTHRRRSGGRKVSGEDEQQTVPFVPAGNSYSYGSPHSNMPKAPQLADTRVPMALALQQKQEAADARMRMQERERETVAGEHEGQDFRDEDGSRRLGPTITTTAAGGSVRGEREGVIMRTGRRQLNAAEIQATMNDVRLRSLRSRSVVSDISQAPTPARSIDLMPPPPLASGRQHSEFSDRSSVGIDTTLGFTRSYVSEDDLDPAIGKKVSQNLARSYVEVEESEVEEQEVAHRQAPSGGRLAPAPSQPAGRKPGNVSDRFAAATGYTQAKGSDTLDALTRRRGRELERARLQEEVDAARADRAKERERREKERRERARLEASGGGGGNGGGGNGAGSGGGGSGSGSGRGGGGGGGGADDIPFNFFGFLNYLWQRWLGVSISGAIKTIIACFFATLIIHHFIVSSGITFGWGKPYRTSSHIPPSEAPKNIDELVSRLHTVEKELGNFGHLASRYETKYREVLRQELSVLEQSLTSASIKSSGDQEKIRSDISSLTYTLDTVKELQSALSEDNKRKLDKLYSDQRALDRKLSDFKALQEARNDAMRAFEEALPKQMVATLGPNGKVQLTPEFQDSLQDVFSKIFPKHFKDAIAGSGFGGVGKIPSWEAFLKGNEHKLRELIEKHAPTGGAVSVGEDGKPGGVVLSRGTVMLMIRREAENYHKKWEAENFLPHFESKFKSQLEELQERIRKENTAQFNTVSSSILAAAGAAASGTVSKAVKNIAQELAQELGKDPSAMENFLQGSKELWATLPDYASALTGASVWPYVTSPSYDWTGGKGYHYYVYRLFGRGTRVAPPPSLAITPSIEAGECWPFPNRSGDIGIKLAQPIHISHVTIDHVPKLQALEYSSAPKNIEFWIRVPENKKEVLEGAVGKPLGEWLHEGEAHKPSWGAWVRVHEFMYDIHTAGSHVQTFGLPVDLTLLNITSRIVAFRIIDNWGHPNFTCLYRVRVHGHPPERVEVIGD